MGEVSVLKYSEGYVAFIDILGFSEYVINEDNGEKTKQLFSFIKSICDKFNKNNKLCLGLSFFSDSIVLVSEKFWKIAVMISHLEETLKSELGLLFRGGICYGKYYHDEEMTFGPAVVSAYRLENKAKYARIIIDYNIDIDLNNTVFYPDVDGNVCINQYAISAFTLFSEDQSDVKEQPDFQTKNIYDYLEDERDKLLDQIRIHKGKDVVEKYLWRVKLFNYFCNCIGNLQENKNLLIWGRIIIIDNKIKNAIFNLKISEDDILNIYLKNYS